MERSSPLAAMHHHAAAMPWGCRPARRFPRSPTAFNFKDLSMAAAARPASSTEYFSLQSSLRGLSPSASLAADLSQNFHIDQSPPMPTPRRSLFTNTLLNAMQGIEPTGIASPPPPPLASSPISSSSAALAGPGPDTSPLPHKAPHTLNIAVPMALDDEDDDISPTNLSMMSPPPAPTRRDVGKHNFFPERRRAPPLRPSLARSKGHSANILPAESQLPAFTFGGTASSSSSRSASSSLALTLGDCFSASPPQDRRVLPGSTTARTVCMAPPPALKAPFSMAMPAGRSSSGPPSMGHVRKSSAPSGRPRKLSRRSLSMFGNPADLIKESDKKELQATGGLQAIMDVDDVYELSLPHFRPEGQPDCLPRISRETLVDVLEGRFTHHYEQTLIVDCRFEYEYDGGHIEGAVNFNDKKLLSRKLFEPAVAPKTLLVFHCEYSAHRAPIMAKFIRQHDRTVNGHRYPALTYPEVYILDGGYSSFFSNYQSRCYPQNYVEMDSKEHAKVCEREMGKLRHRGKIGRSHTFAFGQDSPTAPIRFNLDNSIFGSPVGRDTTGSSNGSGSGISFGSPVHAREHKRCHGQRMASY
ncbi:MAG: cell division cycle- protein [Trizodia sp. TS-e1964]|nr:MAG: cell division cycle- protein [Trizodia sp. TS-e1964]